MKQEEIRKSRMIAISIHIPLDLEARLSELCAGKWGEKAHLVRQGIKWAVERAERDRDVLRRAEQEREGIYGREDKE